MKFFKYLFADIQLPTVPTNIPVIIKIKNRRNVRFSGFTNVKNGSACKICGIKFEYAIERIINALIAPKKPYSMPSRTKGHLINQFVAPTSCITAISLLLA